MASTDARPVPKKNTAFRWYFDLRKIDGTLVTSWTGADTEVSKDGAAYADAASEATEIGTSGTGYIDFTSTEMNADAVSVKITFTNSGALPITTTFFPSDRELDDLAYPTTAGRSIDVTTTGEVGIDLDNAAGTLDAAQFGTDAFTAAKFAADVTTEFQSGIATAAALDAVDNFLDTEVAAILAAVDTETAAILAAVDAEVALILAKLQMPVGLAQAGAIGSITLAAGASAVDSFYVGQVVVILSGTGAGQAREITAYVGATKVVTVAANWGVTPDNTSRYVILAN